MKLNTSKIVWLPVLLALGGSATQILAFDYASAVIRTPNLLGYWRFDPWYQTNSCVNGYQGALQGNAQIGPSGSGCPLVTDPASQGLLLDGTNSYLTTSLTGQITNQGTVLAWVYLTAQPSTAGHFFQITSQAKSGDDFDLQIQTDNKTYFFTDSGGSTVYAQPLPLNQWHFLGATFIANSNRCIYLDGQLVASSTAGAHSVNNTALWIGNNSVFGPRLFQGRIDEVAVFNRALAASEIASVYAVSQSPALNISLQNNAAVLTWSTNYVGFVLQTNSQLNSGNWATLTSGYSVSSNLDTCTNLVGGASPGNLFYRLAYPTSPGMAVIPAGTFMMGNYLTSGSSVTNDPDITDAIPTNVTVSAFYMDTNLVSYGQWQSVYAYATNHGYGFDGAGSGKTANHPVQTGSWYDCVKWCNARSQMEGLTPVYYTDAGLTQIYTNGDIDLAGTNVNWAANGYRLPTEAEWEKAARGGLSGQRFPWGDTISWSQANYYGDPLSLDPASGAAYDLATEVGFDPAFTNGVAPYTSPVGTFPPNNYGLCDMAGNLPEMCWDYYEAPPYVSGSPYLGGTDPRGPTTGNPTHVARGGTWQALSFYARCARRLPPPKTGYLGFRCVRGQ